MTILYEMNIMSITYVYRLKKMLFIYEVNDH